MQRLPEDIGGNIYYDEEYLLTLQPGIDPAQAAADDDAARWRVILTA